MCKEKMALDIYLYHINIKTKSREKAKVLRDIELNFSGVKFKNEDFLYADSDGIVVLSKDDKIS